MAIQKRNIRFGLGDSPAPRWCNNNEVHSAALDALSIFLPPGETFFINSVNAYKDKITDSQLQRDIKEFKAQEALHSREHEAYNNALRKEGLPVDALYQRVNKVLSVKSKLERLAITVAIEHLTACLGHMALKNPELLANSDPRYRDIWTWHSLEELEHQAVTFDIYRQVTAHLPRWKAYLLRCFALPIATRHFMRLYMDFSVQIMALRGHTNAAKAKRKILKTLMISPGYARRILPYYFKFFLPGFSPSFGSNNENMESWLHYFNERNGAE